MEQWKLIEDTNYQVSNLGNVRHKIRQQNLTGFVKNGYMHISISLNGKAKRLAVHRLVAQAFLPNEENKLTVNHINGIKTDNCLENLEWCTQKENVHHSIKTGLSKVRVCPITKWSKDGKEELERFNSIQEIEEKFSFDRSLIIRVCKGKGKSAYGYKWSYTNDPLPVKEQPIGKQYQDYDKYVITKNGTVYSKKTKKFLKPVKNSTGHVYVTFTKKDCKKKNFYIHTLVAKLFLANPNNFSTVIHVNKIKDDNRLENLQWVKYYNQSSQ